ncbi:anti-phage dCTP deaminase [Motiliproteus sp. MSK22-1]|uniref:anti-phage dCTP deaminase n=1 Tax=Motiliproteus sp. MSK22-1 TaxID=1897630 RepID=UPI0009780731|nr:anti-phage dCTP deaminase [Motiliproteus sp. MSK22-1]OMH28084.1 hypothetical protein BGP75_22215 [Motiliproteus sp. MSK22-1]
MAEAAKVIAVTPRKSGQEIIEEQRSEEIVFGFAGAIGCGVGDVVKKTQEVLESAGYEVFSIKLSSVIKSLYGSGCLGPIDQPNYESLEGKEKYTFLQDFGNRIREKNSPCVLADAAITEIAIIRKTNSSNPDGKDQIVRRAYLIDQLKNPEEVKTLRLLYGDSFFLLGVLSSTDDRLKNLKSEDIDELDARALILRDKEENDKKHGQRLQKTLFNADYFIRYTDGDSQGLKIPIERLNDLIHGQKGITPTLEESGMFSAYTASLSSACLSRQVGAAISTPDGVVISTGCNDAPASGGGLYTADHKPDLRCYRKGGGLCHNHKKQGELRDEISKEIQGFGIAKNTADKISDQIKSNTRVGALTEFSRAIHAEMDAILKVARRDSTSTKDCTLYTTTYPCHNCARHIVAAGMKKVVYIEPYEKSLALELHDDAITTDEMKSEIDGSDRRKLVIVQFEGVSPAKYESFFKYKKDTKVNGRLNNIPISESRQMDSLFVEAYHEMEKRIIKSYKERVSS